MKTLDAGESYELGWKDRMMRNKEHANDEGLFVSAYEAGRRDAERAIERSQ